MQWIINIIMEMIEAAGYIKAAYVNRGAPALWDFATGDFTKDGAFHDLDLSSIVPAGAKAVHCRLYIRAGTVAAQALFAKKGDGASKNLTQAFIQVSLVKYSVDFFCALDENRFIEYKFDNITWTSINLCVRGWIF